MAVRESKGKKVQDVVMRDRGRKDWKLHSGQAYEVRHRFSFERRVNRWEARTLISGFFTRWAVKHPEEELRYMELRELSPAEAEFAGLPQPAYETTIHVVHRSPFATMGAIAAGVAAVLSFVAANALEIAVVSALVIGMYTLWRFTDYFRPEEEKYTCPKHPKGERPVFDSWENFRIHFRTKHGEQKLPPKPEGTAEKLARYAGYGLLFAGGALAVRLAYPAIRGKR